MRRFCAVLVAVLFCAAPLGAASSILGSWQCQDNTDQAGSPENSAAEMILDFKSPNSLNMSVNFLISSSDNSQASGNSTILASLRSRHYWIQTGNALETTLLEVLEFSTVEPDGTKHNATEAMGPVLLENPNHRFENLVIGDGKLRMKDGSSELSCQRIVH